MALGELCVDSGEEDGALLDQIRTVLVGHLRHRNAFVVVFSGRNVTDAPAGSRSCDVPSWKNPFNAPKARRGEARTRDEALYAFGELIASRFALDPDDTSQQAAVRHCHRIAKRV